MKIHHINCGSLRVPWLNVNSLVYCLLVESSLGPILVDSGYGLEDYRNPTSKTDFFLRYMGVPRKEEETAIRQVEALGFLPQEVRHIIQTHLHVDHAGGISDFPWATIHISEEEYRAIQKPRNLMDFAYVKNHWAHGPRWERHAGPDQDWFGFKARLVLSTPEADFLLLPLPGHTRGHCGVAIGKPGEWLLHCGDAASPYHPGSDLHHRGPSAYVLNFLPSRFASRILGGHISKLRSVLKQHGDEIQAISSHDLFSYQEYSQASNSE